MRASANALPVMKFDLRCSRACTLWTVRDLHVKLSSREGGDGAIIDLEGRLAGQLEGRLADQLEGRLAVQPEGTPAGRPEARLAGQLNLILQQFDLPDLRHLHISHDFNGDMESFKTQWNQILPEVRLQYWPRLKAVDICVAASYRFLSVDGTMQGIELPRWVRTQMRFKIPGLIRNPFSRAATSRAEYSRPFGNIQETAQDQHHNHLEIVVVPIAL